jgi:hypothetical protein
MLKRIVFLFLLLSALACTKTIDGSNEKTFKASYDKMRAELPKNKANKLDFALSKLLTNLVMKDSTKDLDATAVRAVIYKQVDGMTADEIIELAYGKQEE